MPFGHQWLHFGSGLMSNRDTSWFREYPVAGDAVVEISETLAWVCGIGGLVLGMLAALIPGFPGCAVALLGLVAFAGMHPGHSVTPEALLLGVVVTLAGALSQLAAPVVTSRAAGGAAGVATGAAVVGWLGALAF